MLFCFCCYSNPARKVHYSRITSCNIVASLAYVIFCRDAGAGISSWAEPRRLFEMPGRRTSDDRHVPGRARPVSSDPARRRGFRRGKSSGAQFFAPSRFFLRRFELDILYADQTVKTGEGTSSRHCYVYTRKRGARNTSQMQEQAVSSNTCFKFLLCSLVVLVTCHT